MACFGVCSSPVLFTCMNDLHMVDLVFGTVYSIWEYCRGKYDGSSSVTLDQKRGKNGTVVGRTLHETDRSDGL